LEFEIFEPASEADVHVRTVSRANATCLCCHNVLPAVRVRAQLSEQGGGADVVLSESGKRSGGALLLAVVTVSDQGAGRRYRLADERDYQAVHAAQQGLALLSNQKLADSTSLVPDELTPIGGGSGAGRAFSYRTYGVKFYRQAFSARQTFTLLTFAKLLREKDSAPRALMLALGKL
jgi:adenine-specific DNA methylase